jgi:methyl-accepting chemotaxis protein
MSNIRKTSIRVKLLLGFISVVVVASVGCIVGYYGMISTSNDIRVVEKMFVLSQDAGRVADENLLLRRYEKDFLLNIGDSKKQETYREKFETTAASITEKLSKVNQQGISVQEIHDSIKQAVTAAVKNTDIYI